MITVLLQQILDLLTAHFPGVITLLEKLNLIEPDVEEIRQDVDVIRTKTTDTNNVINAILNRFNTLNSNIETFFKPKIQNISDKTDIIANNIGTISTNTGRAASFAEDCANNTLDIDQKITSIASDTTQMRADNQTLISNTNDIESYLLAMSYGLVKTTAANDNPINFNTDLIEELPLVRAEISPIQAGSGTPSPDNPRALSGISSLDVVLNGDTTSISLGGTVYAGDVDIVNGTGTETFGYLNFDGSESWVHTSSINGVRLQISTMKTGSRQPGWCNMFANDTTSPFKITFGAAGSPSNIIYLVNAYDIPGVSDVATFKTWLSNNNVSVVYPLANTNPITTTPATFTSALGDNQISANSNADLTITFKESVANYIANNT